LPTSSTGSFRARAHRFLFPDEGETPPVAPVDFKAAAADVAAPFIVTRLVLYYLGSLSTTVLQHGAWWGRPRAPIDLWMRWDCVWYLDIVQDGYSYKPGQWSSVAFYPLYPLAVRALAKLGVSPVAAGIFLSNVSLFVGAMLLHALVTRDSGARSTGRAAALFLLVWPVTFFHSVVYSDALFFALFAGALLAVRTGRLVLGGVLGLLLSATRTLGALALIPLALDALGFCLPPSRRPPRRDIAALALVPLGAVAFMLYQRAAFGDAFASMKIQASWGRDMAGVVAAFQRTVQIREPLYAALLCGSAVLLVVVTVAMAVRRARPSDIVWCAIVFYSTAATGSLEAFPRLSMMAVGMFGFFAVETEARPSLRPLLVAVLASLMGVCVSLYTNGYWMT
jgi:Mannosyltransferase (PIG-V)